MPKKRVPEHMPLKDDDVHQKEHRKYLDSLRKFSGIVDRRGRVQFAAEDSVKALGYSDNDVLRKPFWEASWFKDHPESQKTIKDGILQAIEGQRVECRVQASTKDGTALPVTFNIGPLKGSEGDIIGIVAEVEPLDSQATHPREEERSPEKHQAPRDGLHAQSSTVLEEATTEGHEQEELFLALAEHTSDGIAIVQDDIIKFANPHLATMLGCPAENLLDEELSQYMPIQHADTESSRIAAIMAGEEIPKIYEVEIANSKEGSTLRIQCSFTQIQYHGKPAELVIVQDTTDEIYKGATKESPEPMGEALRERDAKALEVEKQVEFILGATKTGLDIIDSQFNLRFVDHAWSQRYGDWRGRKCYSYFMGRSSPCPGCGIPDALATKQTVVTEEKLINEDDRPIQVTTIPFQNHEGEWLFAEVNVDITERKCMEKALRERIKELQCLYALSDLIEKENSIEKVFPGAVELMPRSMQYQDVASARITLDEMEFMTANFQETSWKLSAAIEVFGKPSGVLELCYLKETPRADDGPFLKEERDLILAIADRLGRFTERKRTEEALRASEEKLRILFDCAPDTLFLFDLHGNLVDANRTGEEIAGYSVKEMAGKNMMAIGIIAPEDLLKAAQALESNRQGRPTGPLEISLVRRDGTRIAVDIRTYPIDMHGQSLVLGIARDITGQSEAERALRESEKRFRTLIENAWDAISVVDRHGIKTFESPAVERILGFKPEEVLNKPVSEFLHPDDLSKLLNSFEELVSKPGSTAQMELRFKHKNGSWRWVDTISTNCLNDPTINGIVSNYRDITDQKKAEEALRESAERFRALIENSSDAIAILDGQGNALYESPSLKRILGYAPGELEGRGVISLIHPDDEIEMINVFGSGFLTEPGALKNWSVRVCHKDSSWRWIEGVAQNLLDDPKVKGIVLNYRDITERKQAEVELRAYQERLQEALMKLRISYDEISTPVTQLWDHVLAMPLVGILDTHRAKTVMETLLTKIVETRAQVIILDVTGVATMDTQVTNHLLQTAMSTELLGAESVITGIKPEVAQAMIHIGVDISRLNTKRDLQEGLRYALIKMGYDVLDEETSLEPGETQVKTK